MILRVVDVMIVIDASEAEDDEQETPDHCDRGSKWIALPKNQDL